MVQNSREPRIVKDLEDWHDLILVTDSQEIRDIMDRAGPWPDSRPAPWWVREMLRTKQWGCLFVEVLDGDYNRIFLCEDNIPYHGREVFRVR